MFGTCIHNTRLDDDCSECKRDAELRAKPLSSQTDNEWYRAGHDFDPWHTRPRPVCDCGGAKLKLTHSNWCSTRKDVE